MRYTRLTYSKTGNTLADFQYQFNAVNNITQMIDGAGSHSYTYDALDRLTAVTHPNQTNESYTYDDVGNRTASHQGSSYSYQPFNRLVTANSNSYSYDLNGNLTSKTDASGTWTYVWDYENRLKQASLSGGVTLNYSYDAFGRRVQRTSSTGGTTKFVYDGADVLRDLDGNGNIVADYLNGPGIDNKLRQSVGGATSYLLNDHLSTTRAITDNAGNINSTFSHDSFGSFISGSASVRYTYTGREADTDSGLMFYRARWYDPQQGRFTSEDPIGFAGGDTNLYGYVWQNPLNYRDPSGLDGWGNDFAAWLDRKIDSLRGRLESNPDAVNFNTVVNYATNVYHGYAGLFRVGSGVGNAIYNQCANDPVGDVLRDVGRASSITLMLAGPAAGIVGGPAAAADSTAALGARAAEIHGALDPIAAEMRTTAVLSTEEGVSVVAGGGRDLIPAQRALLGPGEVAAKLAGADAEITALRHAAQNGLTPSSMAVTRTICPTCATAIQQSGGSLTSPTTAIWPR